MLISGKDETVKKKLSPMVIAALLSAVLLFLMQWATMAYLSMHHQQQLRYTSSQLKLETTRNLVTQLSQALDDQDDLKALNVIKTAQRTYTNLHSMLLLDADGHILLHSNPDKMNQKLALASIKPSAKPLISHELIANKWLTKILMPMTHQNQPYFCIVYFDEQPLIQQHKNLNIRMYLMIALTSIVFSLAVAWLVRKFLKQNANQKKFIDVPISPIDKTLAGLLINDHNLLVIDHRNKILSIAPSLLEAGQAIDQVIGRHIFQAALAQDLVQPILQLMKNPQQPLTAALQVGSMPKKQQLTFTCHPGQQQWQLIVVTA